MAHFSCHTSLAGWLATKTQRIHHQIKESKDTLNSGEINEDKTWMKMASQNSTTFVATPATSTTKALLIYIHVPRVHRLYIRKKKNEEKKKEDEDATTAKAPPLLSSTSFASLRSEKPLSENASKEDESNLSLASETKAKPAEHDIGYVEGIDSSKKTKVEHVITAEEMAAISSIEDLNQVEEKVEEKGESLASSVMKVFFGESLTDKADETKTHLNREEAILAMKEQQSSRLGPQSPAPNTEIKVQALLQLTCKNLYNEDCFYTVPTVTSITKGLEEEEWIQFTIMCKPNSIGLVLERLERIGVGSAVGMISIFKSELLKSADLPFGNDQSTRLKENDDTPPVHANLEAAKAEWKNAASRLRVEQVKEQIYEQACWSFDFIALLVIASILAGVGLITNSTVVIVASMLVSPIMGPVMGMTFGSRVLDWSLTKSSAKVEIGALLISILIGAIIGFSSFWATDDFENWPTEEMRSRGDITGLFTGIAIAIPSGMGVALSILGNNTSSLVGVAISASLLPPAVNAGICWTNAILIEFKAIDNEEDFLRIGAISFALTVINILCIWIAGMFMFAVKEVAPSKEKSTFWTSDIKTARATQKHGRETSQVDLETMKASLQDALERKMKQDGRKHFNFIRRRQRSANFSFNLADDPGDFDENDYLEYFMLGLEPIDESADERAAYLGFNADQQDFVVENKSILSRFSLRKNT